MRIKFPGADAELTKLNNAVTGLIESPARSLKAYVDSGKAASDVQDIVRENLDNEGFGKWGKNKDKTIKQKIRRKQKNKILEASGDSRKAALKKGGVKVTLSGGGNNLQATATIEGEAGRIYGYHARGAGHLPVRDVFQSTPTGAERIARGFNDSLQDDLSNRFKKLRR